MDMKTVGPWAVRMLLLALGGWLTRAGVGDDQLWGGLTDILAGPIVLAGTAVWSWRATKTQVQQDPPGSPTVAQAATQAAASANAVVDEVAALRQEIARLRLQGLTS